VSAGAPAPRRSAFDGLRGCAILWVLAYHYVAIPARQGAVDLNPALKGVAAFGWIGVSLFFVLSGYLITGGLQRGGRDAGAFGGFWVKRAFRIAPAYALLLASFLVAKAAWPASDPQAHRVLNTAIPLWSYPLFIQNLFMAPLGYLGNDWLRVLWSLAVEVQFYAVISLLLFLVPRRRTALCLAALAVGAIAFRYGVYFTAAHPEASLVVLLPSRLDAFALGGLAALLPGSGGRRRSAAAIAVAAGSAAFLIFYYVGGFRGATLYAVPLYDTVISLACAAVLDLCATRFLPLSRVMELRPLVHAGRLSYFIYLFHMPVALVVFRVVLGSEPRLGSPGAVLAMAASAAAVCAAAWLSYTVLEGPLIRISHAFAEKPKPAAD
jgi:peptidoglycan/LPS O-acetylase OafA/YrhL